MADTPPAITAPAPKKGIGIAPYAALIGGNTADLLTTLDALKSGRGHEANPFVHATPMGLTLQKAAGTAGIAFLMHELAKRNHPKIAKAMGYIDGGLTGGVAIHNNMVGR